MGSPSSFDPLASGAYALFVTESARQIVRVRALLAEETPQSGDRSRELGATFHTLKGGAGFFGLVEFMEVAARLEAIFSDGAAPRGGEITELVERLAQLSTELPKPRRPQLVQPQPR
jgi:chemotaxis protein histidine kinase CheA